MKILHILDHSIPLHSGYTFRSAATLLPERRVRNREPPGIPLCRLRRTATKEIGDGRHVTKATSCWWGSPSNGGIGISEERANA